MSQYPSDSDRRGPDVPRITERKKGVDEDDVNASRTLAFVGTFRGQAILLGGAFVLGGIVTAWGMGFIGLPRIVDTQGEAQAQLINETIPALEDSLRAQIREVREETTATVDSIQKVVGRIAEQQAWTICTRRPRPTPEVLAALHVNCSFPAAVLYGAGTTP